MFIKNLSTYLENNNFLILHQSAHLWTFEKIIITMPSIFKLYQGIYGGGDTYALSFEMRFCLDLLYDNDTFTSECCKLD